MRNQVLYIVLILILTLSAAAPAAAQRPSPATTIINVPGDYDDLQEAIGDAGPNTVIRVHAGVYRGGYEIVGKANLTIIFLENTYIDANGYEAGIHIYLSENITIVHATINGPRRLFKNSIAIGGSRNIHLYLTNITDSYWGIGISASENVWVSNTYIGDASEPISITGSNGTRVEGFHIERQNLEARAGIEVFRSRDTMITRGLIENASGPGIRVQRSYNTSISIVSTINVSNALGIRQSDGTTAGSLVYYGSGSTAVYIEDSNNTRINGADSVHGGEAPRIIVWEAINTSLTGLHGDGFGVTATRSRGLVVNRSYLVADTPRGALRLHDTGGVWLGYSFINITAMGHSGLAATSSRGIEVDTVIIENNGGTPMCTAVHIESVTGMYMSGLYVNGTYTGVSAAGSSHIVLLDSWLTRVTVGVKAASSNNIRVIGTRIDAPYRGIWFIEVGHASIAHTVLERLGGTPVSRDAFGVYLYRSNSVLVYDTNITGYWNGLHMWRSSGVAVIRGNVSGNAHRGVVVWISSNVFVAGTVITGVSAGVHIYMSDSVDVYRVNVTGSHTGVIVDSSSNIGVGGNYTLCGYAVYVRNSVNVTVYEAFFTRNRNALLVWSTTGVRVSYAWFHENHIAVTMFFTSDAYIYLNTFTGNTYDLAGTMNTVQLYSPTELYYSRGNVSGLSRMGNYWDRQTSRIDNDGDEISDNSYGAAYGTDTYPLMHPAHEYHTVVPR